MIAAVEETLNNAHVSWDNMSFLDEFEKYTQTKMYIEEVARDKLGLVYEGEILFKDENN